MAELINTNVFDANKKFVDFSGLDYFWDKAKKYVDDVDAATSLRLDGVEGKVTTLETTVGNANSGLVKDVRAIQDELNSLSGGAGSIGTQIENALGTLDVADAAVVGQYVSSVSETDGKITVTRADLPDYTEVYDAKGAAAAAEQAAKDYADSLAGNYDAAGTAADLDTAMDARVKVLEAIDHDQLAADAASSAVATVLDGAPEKFDTLKEIADWISSSESADSAADLVTRVSALEAIDHDAYKAADETVLADAKAYADGLADNYDAAGAADGALTDAKAYADGLAVNYEVAGAAKTAEDNAKAYADSLAVNYDAKGAASTALADAKTYVDGKVDGKFDAIGSADAAKEAAIAQAKADAATALADYYKKSETYSKTEVDNLLTTNSTGDRAYAKQYTDELFNSITFASNSDIDALFA